MANTAKRRLAAMTPAELEAAAAEGLDRVRDTELGRLLIAARAEFLREEGRFLTREELEQEIAERKGGVSWDDEE